jgi:hypothetical protein
MDSLAKESTNNCFLGPKNDGGTFLNKMLGVNKPTTQHKTQEDYFFPCKM